jgi:hypothetical protein
MMTSKTYSGNLPNLISRPKSGSIVNAVLSPELKPHGFVMGIATGGTKSPLGAGVI